MLKLCKGMLSPGVVVTLRIGLMAIILMVLVGRSKRSDERQIESPGPLVKILRRFANWATMRGWKKADRLMSNLKQ
jgi:hypothetical protein